MKFTELEPRQELSDPERGFEIRFEDCNLVLTVVDWRDRLVTFTFSVVYGFIYDGVAPNPSLPEGAALEVLESELLDSMAMAGSIEAQDGGRHFVVSTNEGEWLQVVAEGLLVQRRPRVK